MMERCPVCRARPHAAAECPRCGADLSPLLNMAQQAQRYFERSVQCWLQGDVSGAHAAIAAALAIKREHLYSVWRDYLNARG